VGQGQKELESVYATTSNDVWAVGFAFGDPQQPLIEH